MNRLFSIGMIILCAISCTAIESNKTLKDVESYIMERPDSALSVLESMNKEDLVTHRNKAHHALLHAMALDKNYIDVPDDSIAMVAVDYYQKRGSKSNRARALYYLGKSYYYNHEYDKAILEFSKAERVAQGCDSLYLGMIYFAKSQIYNRTHNSNQELYYSSLAYNIFHILNYEKFLRHSQYCLAVSYHNVDDYVKAIDVYDDIIVNSKVADNCFFLSLLGKNHSMIELNHENYTQIEKNFRTVFDTCPEIMEEKDLWAWAFSLYKLNEKGKAIEILDSIKITDELVANFWKLRISVLLEDYEAAAKYNELTDKSQSDVIENILSESLANYQSGYYQTMLEATEYKLQVKSLESIAIVVSFALIFLVVFFNVRKRILKHQEERNKLIEYAEEIKHQLEESERNDYSELKKRYLSLYKSRFETIGKLSDQYHQSEGRVDIESVIFKKVVALINEVKNDSENRIAFERMLDNDLDKIMTNIRAEMPKLKEIDIAIFAYLIIGFDATTISRLLEMSVNNVYAHKRRLRLKIEKQNPLHMNQFLEILT